MAAFSKFLTGKRGSQKLLATDGYTYNQRKDRNTADGCTTWRCSNYRSLKCPCFVSRILIFATKRNLETLAEYPNWIAEENFYVAPKQFYQSFSIHAVIDGKCLPFDLTLLADKTQDTYVFMLNVLKS